MAHNFANLPGYLFTLEEGKAVTDKNYYLTNEADFNLQSLLPVTPAGSLEEAAAVDASVSSSITAAKARDIKQIWKRREACFYGLSG